MGSNDEEAGPEAKQLSGCKVVESDQPAHFEYSKCVGRSGVYYSKTAIIDTVIGRADFWAVVWLEGDRHPILLPAAMVTLRSLEYLPLMSTK